MTDARCPLSLNLFRPMRLLIAFLLAVGFALPTAAQPTSFLVLAPDRGFLGNEEVRDAMAAFQQHVPESELAFATHEKTEAVLTDAIGELDAKGEVVVLPLFLSANNALYRKAQEVLTGIDGPQVTFAEPFGRSYLAEEILLDRIRALKQGGDEKLLLVASGAGSDEQATAIEKDLQPMLERAVAASGLAGGELAVSWHRFSDGMRASHKSVAETARALSADGSSVLAVPFNWGSRLTNMMAEWSWLKRGLSRVEGVRHDGAGILPHPNVARWLTRTANGYLPLAEEEIGVIFVPHGSDFTWNEAMRDALAPLRDRYVSADAFSMVDPVVLERAVRQLEEQGMKAVVVARIFSLESSFETKTEYILGLRDDHPRHPPRIASHLRFATLGGMEADSLLGVALADRAAALSDDPSEETVVLLAHGTGSEEANARWERNLELLAEQIQRESEEPFRKVVGHTWREDWPEKRKAAAEAVQATMEEATANGTALVIPVRTIGQGPAPELIGDFDYRYGEGFAPHPAFVEWVDGLIQRGMDELRATTTPAL